MRRRTTSRRAIAPRKGDALGRQIVSKRHTGSCPIVWGSYHRHRTVGTLPAASGSVVLLPYFLGEKTPLHDPSARGTLVGLGVHHCLEHVWRAALEAVAFGFRHHGETFHEPGDGAGGGPEGLVSSCGGAPNCVSTAFGERGCALFPRSRRHGVAPAGMPPWIVEAGTGRAVVLARRESSQYQEDSRDEAHAHTADILSTYDGPLAL